MIYIFTIFVGVWCAAEPGFLYSVKPKRRKRKGDRSDMQRGRKPTAYLSLQKSLRLVLPCCLSLSLCTFLYPSSYVHLYTTAYYYNTDAKNEIPM